MGCTSSTPCARNLRAGAAMLPAGGALTPRSSKANFYEDYALLEKLGHGSFGSVYWGVKVANGDDVAVKVICIHGKSPAICRQAHAEVSILRRIGSGCEQCVHFVDAFLDNHFVSIITKKCDSTLVAVLQGFDPNEALIRDFLKDMLKGIAFIHSIGILHRDVKIDNFLCSQSLVKEGIVVKLCDFGFADTFGVASGKKKLRGVYGTAPYMSPEMIAGLHDEKTDVWSLGVLLYVLLLGEFPYKPSERSSRAMKEEIAQGFSSPSFSPTGVGIPMPSTLAMAFMISLLQRDASARPSAEECLKHEFILVGFSKVAGAQSLGHAFRRARQIGAYSVPAESKGWPRAHGQELQKAHKERERLADEADMNRVSKESFKTFKLRVHATCRSSLSTADTLSEKGKVHGLAMDTSPNTLPEKVHGRTTGTLSEFVPDDDSLVSVTSPMSTKEILATCTRSPRSPGSPCVPSQRTCSSMGGLPSCESGFARLQRRSPGSVQTMDTFPIYEFTPGEATILMGGSAKSSL